MKLIILLIALIFYISTINSSSSNDLKEQLQYVLNKLEKTKGTNNNYGNIRVKVLKGSSEDDDHHKDFTENPWNDLNNVKDGNGKDLYKKLILGWKQKPSNNKRLKDLQIMNGKTSKDLVIAKQMQPFIGKTYHPDSGKIIQKWKPVFNFKKSPKQHLLAKPNRIVLELKPRNGISKKHTLQDIFKAHTKAEDISDVTDNEEQLNTVKLPNKITGTDTDKSTVNIDSLNVGRRKAKSNKDDSDEIASSSSDEMKSWKEDFDELFKKKKEQALIQGQPPLGDIVNMAAARPWGVPCGDPNQHDMPSGNCMLAAECESEYRIYRGDHLCGRTEFVCCAIMANNYDMFQGFDMSFDDKSMSTDSEEKKDTKKKDRQKQHNSRKKQKRRQRQLKRKRRLKKYITKITKEITKLLDRIYKNGTKEKKKKTDKLRKFVTKLKKQYMKDRQSLIDIHEEEMMKIDLKLKRKLDEIKNMNINFVKNATFRDIVVNGTINRTGARMLVEAYPDLEPYMARILRRSGDDVDNFGDYHEYDLEYGYLYY